jgi:hypothetical protein
VANGEATLSPNGSALNAESTRVSHLTLRTRAVVSLVKRVARCGGDRRSSAVGPCVGEWHEARSARTPPAPKARRGKATDRGKEPMHAVRKKAKKRTRRVSGIEVAARLSSALARSTMLPPAHPVDTVAIKRLQNVLSWEADPADIHRRPTHRP